MKPHTLPHNGSSVDWITPRAIIESLGPFDLDPCACIDQPWPTADRMLTRNDDGLKAHWHGRVWLNPPYGTEIKFWMKRMAEHGDGIALVPARTEVESWFWPYVWDKADGVLFLRGRLFYHRPDGSRLGNAGHGSVLVAYGIENAERLKHASLSGRYIDMADTHPTGASP